MSYMQLPCDTNKHGSRTLARSKPPIHPDHSTTNYFASGGVLWKRKPIILPGPS